jgi:hypothetical protein
MKTLFSILLVLAVAFALPLRGQQDPGRIGVGNVTVTVYFATDGDPAVAGPRAAEVGEATKSRLQKVDHLRFSHYRALGADTQPIFRTYENWAQPLKPSDEILVRFETRSQPTAEAVSLDLELWLSRKKTLKTDAHLRKGMPLYVLGPQWRGGRLIVAVELAPK